MPRKSGETDAQHMDRLRAVRGLPPLMDRTRAAVCFVNTQAGSGNYEASKMNAFLALFHPEMPDDQVRELVHSQRGVSR